MAVSQCVENLITNALKYGKDQRWIGIRACVADGGKNGQTPTNTMYFLNSDYIYYRPHSRRNFKPLAPDRYSVNQDAVVIPLLWMGNVVCSNRARQGRLLDAA